jgi:hypothetical protein
MNISEIERTTYDAKRMQSVSSTAMGRQTDAVKRGATAVERRAWTPVQSALPPAVRMFYHAPTTIRWGINE